MKTGTQGDQSFVELLQKRFVHSRFIVESFLVSCGNQSEEILVTNTIFYQENQMEGNFSRLSNVLFKPGTGSNIDFTSDDRLDTGLVSLLVKFHRPEHISVIGDSDCRHLKCLGSIEEVLYLDRPIEKAVLGMNVEMDKSRVFHIPSILLSFKQPAENEPEERMRKGER